MVYSTSYLKLLPLKPDLTSLLFQVQPFGLESLQK